MERKNKRKIGEKQPSDEKTPQVVLVKESRTSTNVSLKKHILILCEGETEAAYFYGLDYVWNLREAFEIEIMPDKDEKKNEGYKNSSAKALLYEAMQRSSIQKIPYDSVWIVLDNDEGNAYKLDDNTINKLKNILPENVYEQILSHQKVTMNVRKYETEKERIRYFLNESEYIFFLSNLLGSTQSIVDIVSNTTKNKDFDILYGYRKSFFYDENGTFLSKSNEGTKYFSERFFDEKILNSVQVAYTCIAFEHWILLHFERNNHNFYNSREIIKHFDDKNYFSGNYKKGWFLYEEVKDKDAGIMPKPKHNFFLSAKQAIKNNIWLNTIQQQHINLGKKFYEVNPYSDVYLLICELLSISTCSLGIDVTSKKFKDINVSKEKDCIIICFLYNDNDSVFLKNIGDLFSIEDVNGMVNIIPVVEANHEYSICRKEDEIIVTIQIPQDISTPYFLFLKEHYKNEDYTFVWCFT